MVRKGFCVLSFILILLLPVLVVSAPAMVVDDAGLLSSSEKQEMEKIIREIRDVYQIDAVVLTTDSTPDFRGDDRANTDWADRYYEDHGYGLGEDRSGVLLFLDMKNRYFHVSTAGDMRLYLNDHRIEEILDAAEPHIRGGHYGQAMIVQLEKLRKYLQNGIEEGTFLYDEHTGQRLTGLYNRLTGAELAFALAAGAVSAGVFFWIVLSRYHLRGSTYRYDKKKNINVRLTRNDETYLRSHVTRFRHSSSGGGSRGSSGGGRGSGVHTSSGGISHGGGGRHF